ncbi:MAG: hypothetical protein LBE08_13170 [Bifidobacteriaceae bacterium]|nr:hypothetical protein [Bifidobacteriaceae bacterium]
MSYGTWSLLATIAFAAAGAALVAAIVLFFALHISDAVGVLTGRRTARGVAGLQAATASRTSGRLGSGRLGSGRQGRRRPGLGTEPRPAAVEPAPLSDAVHPLSGSRTGTTPMAEPPPQREVVGVGAAPAPVPVPAPASAPAAIETALPSGGTTVMAGAVAAPGGTTVLADGTAVQGGATALTGEASLPTCGTTVMGEPGGTESVLPGPAGLWAAPDASLPTGGATVMGEPGGTESALPERPGLWVAPDASLPTGGTTVMGQTPLPSGGTTVMGVSNSSGPPAAGPDPAAEEPADPDQTRVVARYQFSSAKESL